MHVARDLSEDHIRDALGLERTWTAVARARAINDSSAIVHRPGCPEKLTLRADVEVALPIEGKVRARQDAFFPLAHVPNRDVGVMTVVELDSSALKSTVAFTGRLACMTRAEAFEVVRSHGGKPSQEVTRRTNVLVVGELGWPLLDDGRPSNKLSRASSYGVPVISERRFLEWIGKAVPDSLHRTYSADQIATLSKLSSSG
jgi:NAD-dependent DNA ligase